jgi:hypothetical protein
LGDVPTLISYGAQMVKDSALYKPTDKLENRVYGNFLAATAMLGHLCALYDRGVFQAGRLMSTLLFQLAIQRRSTNIPLLKQIGVFDSLRVSVDFRALSKNLPSGNMTALVGFMFGLAGKQGRLMPSAYWLPMFQNPGAVPTFAALFVEEWLNDPVIPTTQKTLSRKDLIEAVRDQDGGAHSDPDRKLQKSTEYVELINSFPISKMSHVKTPEGTEYPWEFLPPVTMPILRQISHELLSSLYSQIEVLKRIYLPSLVCTFNGTDLLGAFVPEGYPDMGLIYGKTPGVIARPIPENS